MQLDVIKDNYLTMGKANQVVFSETLQELAKEDKEIVIITSDSRGSGKLVPFAEKFPKQVIEVGIAEQNLVGIASGLASAGKKSFAISPACFLTARSLEQIKNDVAYSNNTVKLVGISAGLSYGILGTTHHSLHDFAVLRAINNIIIVAPADNFETEQAVHEAAKLNQPIYLRFGKKAMPFLDESNQDFKIGKGRIVNHGDDITIIATGETVYPAILAAKSLKETNNINAKVVSMHTIKPLDVKLLDDLVKDRKPIITIEEHMVNGGLGEACASYLFQKGAINRFHIMAIPDEYTVTGSQLEIFNHYGISQEGISKKIIELLKV
ncbi:transketolase [Polaribacter reichenbachii]|uniref:Transketolase n=1 Tax=Polaribacter reichenbachii TaxID=996801 RepID=A0A1B8TNJ6_9FLAO|nr:transketolase C-terminal domain-containing protein [Polaribacter reichenbachii]APZ46673.1 transketolase [Polaribacter reichenbachii]AUC17316.1 transketolase [Polaribacter reichenbachii]OBY61236.1 transketolase [Polaribacter reichenbachii]